MLCYALFKSLNRSSTYLGFGSIPILINKPFALFRIAEISILR